MKILKILLVGLIPLLVNAQIIDQNFLITSGIEAGLDKGDSLYRTVINVDIPTAYPGKVHFRVFDADLGDTYDNPGRDSRTRYLVFGQNGISENIFSIKDSIDVRAALVNLSLGQDPYYDNRWRTIGSFRTNEGLVKGDRARFRVVVDGISGSGRNRYQLFISADDKRNEVIEGAVVTSPAMCLRMATNPTMTTQITFSIPTGCDTIVVNNFDGDMNRSPNKISFETNFRNNIAIKGSGDGELVVTTVAVLKEEQGRKAALAIEGNIATNNIQFWITDKTGRILELDYPPQLARRNSLPIPKFKVIPLASCNTVILDATESSDPDGDELTFKWYFEGGESEEGIRIAHDFKQPGKHPVKLLVIDNSIYIANTSRITQTVVINEPPKAVIEGVEKAAPYQSVYFDAHKSYDTDGNIIAYQWNMGDGTVKSGVRVSHKYTRPGNYKVALTVEDDGTTLCTKGKATAAIWINRAPQARLNLAKNLIAVEESVSMDADGSIDSDGEIIHYHWNFGDGSEAEGIRNSHRYKQPGKYTVQLTVRDDSELANAEAYLQEIITVNAPPVAKAEFPKVVAANELVIMDAAKSVDPDGQISEYRWTLGDGSIKAGSKIRHRYAQPGTYPIKLTVLDNTSTLNNSDVVTYSIRVNNPPVPDAGGDRLVNESVIEFDATGSRDSDDEIIEYSWNFGDGQTGIGEKISHVYASPGTYNVTLTVKDASGTKTAIQSETVTITVNSPPVADAGREQIAAIGEKVRFKGGFSNDSDGKIVTYRWTVDEGVVLEGKNVTHVYERPGIYQVQLLVIDNDGAEDIHTTTVFVNTPPVAKISPISRIAPDQVVPFDGGMSYDLDGRIDLYEWDFGDGSLVKKGQKVKHSFKEPGRFTVSLTVKDNSNAANGISKATQTVAVNYPPKPDCGADIVTCDQTILFDASNSSDADKDKLTYFWDFGDGNVGSGMKYKYVYQQPGVYPVTLRVNDGQGLANSIQQQIIRVQVNSAPVAVAEVNRDTVCAGEPVMFDASKSRDNEKDLMRYQWNFGDAITTEGINPIHSFKRGGNYRVRLTVTDDSNLSCNSSVSDLIIHVIDAPVADAGEDQTVCANTVVQFDGSKSRGGDRLIKSYEWDFGDGEQGGGINPTHVYTRAGIYTVRLMITVPEIGDCENTSESELTVKVIAAPTARFTMNERGCINEVINFDASESIAANSNIVSYEWDFGDGNNGSGEKVTHRYISHGRYTVKLKIQTDSDQGCNSAEASHVIDINAAPAAAITVFTSNEKPASVKIYRCYRNTVLNFSGEKSDDKDGYIKEYLWDFGDGNKAAGVTIQHQYPTIGSYQVRLYVEDNSNTYCDFALDSITVDVLDYSEIAISGPEAAFVRTPLEYKLTTTKKITPSAENTIWYFSDGTTVQGLTAGKTFTQSGTYQVQAKCGELWSQAQKIIIDDLPEVKMPDNRIIDLGQTVQIIPAVSNPFNVPIAYEWEFGDGEKGDGLAAEHQYMGAGDFSATFKVWYKEIGFGQPQKYTMTITVLPAPVVEIGVQPEKLYVGGARDAVFFESKTQPYSRKLAYQWDFGDGITAVGKTAKHTYMMPGDYTIKLTVYDASRLDAKRYEFTRRISVTKR